MAKQICSHCGYEGRGKQAGERRGGGLARVLGMLLMLPIHSLWKAGGKRAGKLCPHCGLPTMVTMKSDAGWMARQKMDIALGAIAIPESKEKPVEAFGNERSAETKVTKKPVNPDQW